MRCPLLTLVALAACRGKAVEPPPPPPPHDGVTLIQPGAPPLEPLRYRLIKGSKTASELMCDVEVKSEQTGPMPTLVVDLETTVEDVLADGSARLRVAVVGTSVRDRPGSETGNGAANGATNEVANGAMQAQAAALRNVVITQTLAPDGSISDAHVVGAEPEPGSAGSGRGPGVDDKLPAQLDSLLRSLERVAMRLPAEPVGVGASWRERTTLPEGGIRAVSEITYTLVSITGSTIAYTAAGQSSGAPHTLEQDGVKVEITGTRGRSTIQGSVDLSRYALEVTATSTFSTTMAVLAPDAGPGSERSTVEIAMAIRMTPGAPAAAGAETPEPAAAPPDAALSPEADHHDQSEPGDHGAHSAP